MMANLSERDQRTLRLGGIGAAVILGVVFVAFPVMDAWDDRAARIETAQRKLREIEEGINEAADASNSSRSLRAKANVYATRAELNQQIARTLQRVQALPGYESLTIRRIEGLPVRDEGEYFRSGVSMQFTGSLKSLHGFLDAVEAAEPTLKVDRLSLTQDQKTPSRIEGQVVINSYAVVTEKGKRG